MNTDDFEKDFFATLKEYTLVLFSQEADVKSCISHDFGYYPNPIPPTLRIVPLNATSSDDEINIVNPVVLMSNLSSDGRSIKLLDDKDIMVHFIDASGEIVNLYSTISIVMSSYVQAFDTFTNYILNS